MPLNYAHGYYKSPPPLASLRPGEGEFATFGTDTPPSVTDTITVTNSGASTPVELALTLAAELTIQTVTVSHGSFDGAVWSITSLPANTTATLEIYSTAITPITEVSSITYDLSVGTSLAISATRTEALTPSPGDIQKLWLTAENACGYTEISDPVEVIFSTTDALEVNLPTSARSPVTGFMFYHLAIGPTASTATRIYRWQSYDSVTGAELTLNPVILSRDEHLEAAPSVATPADLPVGADRLPGQTRLVIGGVPTSAYYLYDPLETAPVNGQSVIADSTGGKWSITMGTPILGQVDPFGEAGCAQLPTEVDPQTVRRSLLTLNATTPVTQTIWTRFHYVAERLMESGTGLQIAPFLDNKFHPGLFKGGIKLRFKGYVNLDTGELVTANPASPTGQMVTLNQEYIFDPFFPTYELETELTLGFAAVFEVSLFISKAQIGNEGGVGSLFSIDIRPIEASGIPALWGYFTGDLVFNTGERLRVLPDGTIGTGHAVIGRETHPPINSRRDLIPLLPDTVGLKIVINGRGDVFIRNPGEPLPVTEGQRALVDLSQGYSEIIWSEPLVLDNQGISLTRTIPNYDDVVNVAVIKPSYPTIGGMTCSFTAEFCKLFLEKNGMYYEYVGGLPLNPLEVDTIEINSLTNYVAVTNPEASVSINSFFANPDLSVSSNLGGTLTAGTWKVGFAYYFSGTQISRISHDIAEGCIPEMGLSLAEMSLSNSAWGKTYSNAFELQNTPTATLPRFHEAKVIIDGEPIDVIFDPLSSESDYPSSDRTVGGWVEKDSGGLLWALVMSD